MGSLAILQEATADRTTMEEVAEFYNLYRGTTPFLAALFAIGRFRWGNEFTALTEKG